jgi:hypothetical protein
MEVVNGATRGLSPLQELQLRREANCEGKEMNDNQVQQLEERLSHLRSQLIGLRDLAQSAVKEIGDIRHWLNGVVVDNLKAQLDAETTEEAPRR